MLGVSFDVFSTPTFPPLDWTVLFLVLVAQVIRRFRVVLTVTNASGEVITMKMND